MNRRWRIVSAAVAAVAAVAATAMVAACGSADEPGSDGGVDRTTSEPAPCPAMLPEQPSGEEFGADPAAEAPDLPEATDAFVCEYRLDDSGTASDWELTGEMIPVPADDLADLGSALDKLQPASDRFACTEELGPRYLVVMDTDDGRTSVAVDDFGCRFARVLGDPVEAGADATSGVLATPQALVPMLRDLIA